MNTSRIIAVLGSTALALVAAPAMPTPAPVPEEIPVALLVDLSSGQTLFSREEGRRFMPASVTKVMTAFTAFKLIYEGQVSPATRFEISQELQDEWSGEGSTMFLQAGEQPTIGELLLGATTVSGNDACIALALATTGSVEAWLDLMNANAVELGMRDTHFGSPNGYPDGGQTFTSARDLARLGEALVTRYPQLYHRYFGHRTLTWREITQYNHDPITGRVEGADGIKTGFTNEAGYTFLGSGARDGRRLVMVLAGSPTARLRDETARALLEWGFSDFESEQLAPAGLILANADVQNGSARHVGLRTPAPVRIALPEGEGDHGEARYSIRYNGPLLAPIAEGEQVATLYVSIDGMPTFGVPLEAAETVTEANFLQRIGNGLVGLFT